MTQVLLPSGRDKLPLDLPDGVNLTWLKGRPMPALPDPLRALRHGLADPFGRPPLKLAARKVKSAVIVLSDYTRNVLYPLWLTTLMDELNAAGIPDERITLYLGGGTHRSCTEDEQREGYGAEALRRGQVVQHNCDDKQRMRKVGRTDRGTVVELDERICDAELIIVTGAIQYHYFAGYSGGRKALVPGCASRETILTNHKLCLDPKTMDFARGVVPGLLVTNPVNEDMEQAASAIKPDLCINLILNENKEAAWIGVGDISYVLREGALFLDALCKIELAEGADLAILSSGGYPKDLTLFQAHKALKHLSGVLNPGAKVIWIAGCEHGEGTAEFESFRALELDEIRSRITYACSQYSMCALSLKTLASRYEIHLISQLPPENVSAWGMFPHPDATAALAACRTGLSPDARWLVAPDMSNLLPVRQAAKAKEEQE